MISFLDFIAEKRKYTDNLAQINEAFKNSDVDKVLELVTKLFKKNIKGGTVLFDHVPYNTTVSKKKCVTYSWYLVKNGKMTDMWTFNYLVDSKSSVVYSIDIYDEEQLQELLYNPAGTKTSVSVFTQGHSIAYFLPVVYHIINNHDYTLSQKEAKSEVEKVFKESVSESFFSVGNIRYSVLEGISNQTIYDAFMLSEAVDRDVAALKMRKKMDRDAAYQKKVQTKDPEDIAAWQQLDADYKELVLAIKNGAETLEDLEIVLQQDVTVSIDTDAADKYQAEIEQEHESPDQAFKKMQQYIKLVVKGLQNSVIICGAPGVGKTYNVKKQLKASGYNEGHNLITIKGKCTPRVLYMTLYQYQDKGDIVLIDDADSLVGPKAPEDCINILKGALDTSSDDEGRLVVYGVSGKLLDDEGDPLPKRFYYRGGVIVLTNYQAGSLDTALRGRSYIQDIHFTTADILERIKSLIPDLCQGKASPKAKMKAFDYLNELLETGAPMDLSMRGFELCAKLFQMSEDEPDCDEEMAKKMIQEQMRHQAARASRNAKY